MFERVLRQTQDRSRKLSFGHFLLKMDPGREHLVLCKFSESPSKTLTPTLVGDVNTYVDSGAPTLAGDEFAYVFQGS